VVGIQFRFLLRKKTLVDHVQIDPATFAIALFDAKGQSIPKQRLSDGEKPVFAISVLWGLAQASPRPLPAINSAGSSACTCIEGSLISRAQIRYGRSGIGCR
jgi:DNA sulfur modification protein DndD